MTPKEKAWSLLEAINGSTIDVDTWNKASDYAKKELKRKANIVTDEILNALSYKVSSNFEEIKYYAEVKQEIEKL